jgi:succinyl-CoA synthetase beta subunit
MKLLEHQGKELFGKYGIATPKGELVFRGQGKISLSYPIVLKSQILSGNRREKGGIVSVERAEYFLQEADALFQKEIDGVFPQVILAEERVEALKEWYISLSYDTDARGPVLALSDKGGSGIQEAETQPLLWEEGRWELPQLRFPALTGIAQSLLELFLNENALLAEINPLFELAGDRFVAGDAKVILDDNVVDPSFRPFLDLPGDIAILASGGGASLINLDALILVGGKPANYVEYSGNPPASVVEELTIKALSRPGLKGCWTVGGTANFTDIFETMSGFVEGLRKIEPKPTYPIVVRRDGPRQKEAFEMLQKVAREEGFDLHVYGPETPMSESAKIMVQLAYGNSR